MKFLMSVLLAVFALVLQVQAADGINFKLKSISGELVELEELCKDGPVLISFWATFCEPCKKEIPHLIEMLPDFSEQNLQLVLISVDTPRSQKRVKPFVKGKKWDVPVLFDPNGKTMRQFKGSDPPYTMLVDENAQVLYKHSGYKPGDEKALKKKLAKLLVADTADTSKED